MATVNMSTPMPYGMQRQHDEACRRASYLTHIRRTSVMQLIGGCLLIALGIVAIILRAYWSYFSTSIWSGLLIFGLTGLIGMCASSNGNKCLINLYLCMSILACLMGFALFEMHIHAASNEARARYSYYPDYTYYTGCQPGDWYSFIPNCSKSQAARQTFDALICITGFFLFILSIISASFGCCAACKCCKPCCKKCCCNGSGCSSCCAAPKPVTAVYQHQGAMVSTAGQQQVPYQAGMYIVQQAPPSAMQPQQVSMPPPGSTNQGQISYMMPPPSANQPQPSHLVAPPQSGLVMQPQPGTSNIVAPPSYYVAGAGHAQLTTVEQPHQEKDGLN